MPFAPRWYLLDQTDDDLVVVLRRETANFSPNDVTLRELEELYLLLVLDIRRIDREDETEPILLASPLSRNARASFSVK